MKVAPWPIGGFWRLVTKSVVAGFSPRSLSNSELIGQPQPPAQIPSDSGTPIAYLLVEDRFHRGVTGQNEHRINRSIGSFRAVYAGSGTLLLRSVEQCDAELRTEVPDVPTGKGARGRTGGA